jgi:hypothetical protein
LEAVESFFGNRAPTRHQRIIPGWLGTEVSFIFICIRNKRIFGYLPLLCRNADDDNHSLPLIAVESFDTIINGTENCGNRFIPDCLLVDRFLCITFSALSVVGRS